LNRIERIETTLPKLEELKILTKQNRYRKMLVDITKEIQNERDVKEKQKIELVRLKDSLKSLEEHYKFLTEKTEGLEQYIEETRKKHYEEGAKRNKRKTKKKDSFKFSYKQLAEKHKVIEDISVGKAQRSLIKFQISMPVPGKFDVEAMLAGKTLHTIQLDLDELLDKQSRHQETIEYDGVKLNVNMTIHMLNKLFSTKH
jgi:septal ring factor EnvC (AmiA/AmiB activator)